MNALKNKAIEIAQHVQAAGGRALIVGGFVRDELMGFSPKDLDLECFKVEPDVLAAILAKLGKVDAVGDSFKVLKLSFIEGGERFEIDVSIPRIDKKVGVGHKGFEVTGNPNATLEDAARRRDFTINALFRDPITDELLDPFGGIKDLESGILRAVDPKHFGEDPPRVLRAFQFASRFSR